MGKTNADLFIPADLTSVEGIKLLAERALDFLGGIDILINNIGGSSAPAAGYWLLMRKNGWKHLIGIYSLPFGWIEN